MAYKWLASLLLLGISIADLKQLSEFREQGIYINYMAARAEARNFHHFLGNEVHQQKDFLDS